MKIRHPVLIKAAGFAIACLVRLWISTIRYRYRPLYPNLIPGKPGFEGHYLYAFWHEDMLVPAYHYGRRDVYVLISQHADGRLVAEVIRHLRFRTIAGSSTRGGIEAVRRMMRLCRVGQVVFTPDGPRGPRRRVQPGLVYLASRTGLPIVPFGFGYGSAWRARSWDRFALPRPWTDAVCVMGAPIPVPENLDKEGLESYRLLVEGQMNAVSDMAQSLATKRRSGARHEADGREARAAPGAVRPAA